jgi:hypothetical protein
MEIRYPSPDKKRSSIRLSLGLGLYLGAFVLLAGTATAQLCNGVPYNTSTSICCGGVLSPKGTNNACCGTKSYNTLNSICCGGS